MLSVACLYKYKTTSELYDHTPRVVVVYHVLRILLQGVHSTSLGCMAETHRSCEVLTEEGRHMYYSAVGVVIYAGIICYVCKQCKYIINFE